MPPAHPKIFHITHLENLKSIVDGDIWSDAQRLRQNLACTIVGMSEIKRRRLEELRVPCCDNRFVGEFVPFYLCPRSIMLYLLHRGNHENLNYTGGQTPILRLQADLNAVVQWATERKRPWAISRGNAGSRYRSFFASLDQLDELNWAAIDANDWKDPMINEAKQSEFLVLNSFPWALVETIGVISDVRRRSVLEVVANATHQPPVVVRQCRENDQERGFAGSREEFAFRGTVARGGAVARGRHRRACQLA